MRARHCNSRRRERPLRRARVALLEYALAGERACPERPADGSAFMGTRRDPHPARTARRTALRRGVRARGTALRLRLRAFGHAVAGGAVLLAGELPLRPGRDAAAGAG